MSNYPPTPAFGGPFTVARSSFAAPPKLNSNLNSTTIASGVRSPVYPYNMRNSQRPNDVSHAASNGDLRIPTGGNATNAEARSEGEREEGEVSDVEMDSGSNDEVAGTKAHGADTFGSGMPGGLSNTSWPSSQPTYPYTPPTSASWAQSTINGGHGSQDYQSGSSQPNGNVQLRYYSTSDKGHAEVQAFEELRKKAEAAVLNLLPLKLTFKDFVDEGIHPLVLQRIYKELGLSIPEEFLEAQKVTPIVQDRRPSDQQKPSTPKDTKRSLIQERLRKQELILKDQEEQKKELQEKKLREEKEKKEREEANAAVKAQEEAIAAKKAQDEAIAAKRLREEAEKKAQEERQMAEAARKRDEELKQELKAKKEILQKKFEEMRLPAKPPAPAVITPTYNSLPSRVTESQTFPPPPFLTTSSTVTAPPIMIPGLLLDSMDMVPRAPETPMAAPTPTGFFPGQNILNQIVPEAIVPPKPNNEDQVMKDASDRVAEVKQATRRKRPVAADFDIEPSSVMHQAKRRFGSLKHADFIIELTDDEEEDDGEIDDLYEPTGSSGSPNRSGASQYNYERNGKTSPARTSSTANGNSDAAKQLQDTEEKIRELRRTIQQMQEKKRKPTGSGTATNTNVPSRIATPLTIPGIGLINIPPENTVAPTPSMHQAQSATTLPPKPPPPAVEENVSSVSESEGVSDKMPVDHEPVEVVTKSPTAQSSESQISGQVEQIKNMSIAEPKPAAPAIPTPNKAPHIQEESDSQTNKKQVEAERLRMLLLSKRKALEEGRAAVSSPMTPAEPLSIPNIADIPEQFQTNGHTMSKEIQASIHNAVGAEIYPHDTFIAQHSQSPQSDRSESPPYEPSLETERKPSESPPYEPSLGPEDTYQKDYESKMEVDEDTEEGEIVEESVDMDVDSTDDEEPVAEEIAPQPTLLGKEIQDSLQSSADISQVKPQLVTVVHDTKAARSSPMTEPNQPSSPVDRLIPTVPAKIANLNKVLPGPVKQAFSPTSNDKADLESGYS
ncbi:hypothetical protein DFH27DRAFT_526372 [Peziza echinospora]|nr:hypothetical protein DFH27DRAFT_526372 [Peziza echinospora]